MFFVKVKASRHIPIFLKENFRNTHALNIQKLKAYLKRHKKNLKKMLGAEIIKQLRKMRGGGRIKVRLLMTSGCIEYWLMLHYKMFAPAIRTTSDKKRILNELKIRKPNYKKGDFDIIAEIAQRYPFAVKNAESTLKNLLTEGMPSMCDDDERNHWLYSQGKTFSNVYEAIVFLEELIGKENNMEKMQ